MLSVRELTVTLSIFSAMLTPVILISACGSLTVSTSNRFTRAIERARALAALVEKFIQSEADILLSEERRALTFRLLLLATRRARLLHRSLTFLYVAIFMFILAGAVLGLLALTNVAHAELALLAGGIGMAALCASCVLLIAEARIARRAIDAEMNFTLQIGERYAPEDLAHAFRPAAASRFFGGKTGLSKPSK